MMREQKKFVAAALGAALALAACGLDAAGGGDDLSEAEKTRIAEAFRDCMAEGGLDAAVSFDGGIDIDVSGGDIAEEDALRLEAECEPLLAPLDGGFELTPEDEARMADASLAAQKCLAEKGYVVTISPDGGIETDSADQAAGYDGDAYFDAEEECFRTADPELFERLTGGSD